MAQSDMNINALVDSLTAQSDTVFQNFAYEGFNPILIRKKIMERPTWKDDLPVFINLYVQRGTNTTKILKTVSEEGKRLLEEVLLKYNVKPSVTVSSGRTVLTLSRIAAAYPDAVVRLINDKPKTFNTPINLDNWEGVPPCLMVPCFASTIPKKLNWITEAFLERHFDLMSEFDSVINFNSPTPTRQMKIYQDAAFNTKVMTEALRMDCFKKLELIQLNVDDEYELTEKGEKAVETTEAFVANTGLHDMETSTEVTAEDLREARTKKRKSLHAQTHSSKKKNRRGHTTD